MSGSAARSVLPRMSSWLQGKVTPLKQWHREALIRHKEGLAAQLAAPATGPGALPEVIPFKDLGWGRKILGGIFLLYMGMNAYPIISEGTLKHGVCLLQRKDPFFKRSGASRITVFAITDDRRRQVVRMGGIHLLLDMLKGAREDKTRIAALKSMSSLCQCDAAVRMLEKLGGRGVLEELSETSEDAQILSLISAVEAKLNNKTKSRADKGLAAIAGTPVVAV